MRKAIIAAATAVTLSMSACAPTSQTPNISSASAQKEAEIQRELAVKENMQMARKLENVAAPILMANASLCGDLIATYIGGDFVTKDSVSKNYQNTMANLYGVGDYPTLTMVGRGTPAAAKLRIGDMVTHVNGEALPSGKKSLDALDEALAENKKAAPMTFTIDRAGQSQTVMIDPVHACDSPVRLTSVDDVNASADGEKINITKGMMRFVENDTELATVIGHELAHNTRAHIDSKRGNAMVGLVLGAVTSAVIGVNVTDLGTQLGAAANSQAFEEEADYIGLYHAARAGYNISDAPNLWRRMAANNARGIHLAGGTHPSSAKRFLALEATVQEINAKRARGEKLIPEEKEVQQYQEREKGGVNG